MQAGITFYEFFDLTIEEIELIVEAYNEKVKNDYKKELALGYSLADLTSAFVARRIQGKSIPSFQETYPGLFNDTLEISQKEEKSWQIYKESFMDFAIRHNKKRGVKQNDNRRTKSTDNSIDTRV